MAGMEKHFIGEQELLLDAYRLAVNIHNDGFRPTRIVGLWPGGASVGVYMHESLRHLGLVCEHYPLRVVPGASSNEAGSVGLESLARVLERDDRLLIVDAVFASGATIRDLLAGLTHVAPDRMPRDIRRAAVWYRHDPLAKRSPPEYWLHETDRDLVMPFEINRLGAAEIATHKP